VIYKETYCKVVLHAGGPCELDQAEVESELQRATALMEEEALRSRPAAGGQQFSSGPVAGTSFNTGVMSDSDIQLLREKHLFLAGFSDNFIRMTPVGDLMRIESTALKARELERAKDADDRLAVNKTSLAATMTSVPAGSDNRWSVLHQGRFLGGACCSSAKLWLAAKEYLGSGFAPPVGNYDMGAVGLADYVSAQGWAEIHNPASTKLSVRMFNINNCSARASSKKAEDGDEDFNDVAEFKLAIRAMRTAMQFVMPWNLSVLALEGFFFQTNFCGSDLANVEKRAWFLTKFADYVISLNADRWRDSEPFLTTGELKGIWSSFFGAQPHSAVASKGKQKNAKQGAQKAADPRLSLGICFAYNLGNCLKAPGTCTTAKGRPLKHVCDFAADPAKPTDVCGKEHIRKDFHK
jgi:hypothetical protein